MIELENVSISFRAPLEGERVVLESLSVSIQRGDMVYLVGPSGSGKSTLLRLIYMDLLPEKGRVRVREYDSSTIKPRQIPLLRREMGIVFQDYQLLPDRNVFENVAFALYATGQKGRAVKSRVYNVLSQVQLSHKLKSLPHELSGGEQQRVCLARAIANEPHILLADEPTGNLDPIVANDIQQLILSLHRQGMTVLIATHDYRLVKEFPARTLAFVKGQLMEVNPGSLEKQGDGGRRTVLLHGRVAVLGERVKMAYRDGEGGTQSPEPRHLRLFIARGLANFHDALLFPPRERLTEPD